MIDLLREAVAASAKVQGKGSSEAARALRLSPNQDFIGSHAHPGR
jgi:hypothetical protein